MGKRQNYPATQETEGAKTAPDLSMDANRHGPAAKLCPHRDRMESASGGSNENAEQTLPALSPSAPGLSMAQVASTAHWHRWS